MTVPPNPADGSDVLDAGTPEPGALKLKERRSWKTWQLLSAILLAAIFGMWINGDTGGGASSATGSNPDNGKLPAEGSGTPAAGGATTATTAAGGGSVTTTTAAGGSAAGGSAAGGTTTTTAAGGATTTTTAGATGNTGAAASGGPARVLLLSPQQKGNWTSTAFTTTTAPWSIGWAFQCAPAPASGASFQVFVAPASTPSASGTPALSETGASGQSVTSASSLGAQVLVVQAPPSCTWIVKVTGS